MRREIHTFLRSRRRTVPDNRNTMKFNFKPPIYTTGYSVWPERVYYAYKTRALHVAYDFSVTQTQNALLRID